MASSAGYPLVAVEFFFGAVDLTHDSFSDLVLFAVCSCLALRYLAFTRDRAGIGIACLLIAIAAFLGVIRFSDWNPLNKQTRGPHEFASMIAAVGAFPVLAFSLAFPDSPIARRVSGAWWLAFVVGGFGFAVWLLAFKPWGQIAPALSGFWMVASVATAYRGTSRWLGIGGLVLLFTSLAVTVLIDASSLLLGIFSPTQLLHYFLAAGLLLLACAAETAVRSTLTTPENALPSR